MELQGAIVLVTGAAGAIGAEIAAAFAREGAYLGLADVQAEPLQQLAQRLQQAGGRAVAVVADSADEVQVAAMVAGVEKDLGPIDVLINCAGRLSAIGPVWEVDPDRWQRDVVVNLCGTFLCCRQVLPSMIARGSGYILNLVGGGVDDTHAFSSAYAASKVGVLRLTEALAHEARPHGVKTFAMQPPLVRSAMTRYIACSPEGRRWRPGFQRHYDEASPDNAAVVADLALWLVSGQADALTGRYIEATQDRRALLESTAAIVQSDCLTLRIRR